MLTVKSILTGALVVGAATVPAGVVVTDLATDSVPAAPGAITAEAPVLAPTGISFEVTLVSVVLVPSAPSRAVDVREPGPSVAPFPEIELKSVLLLPPRPAPVTKVEGPRVVAPALALEDARLTPVSIAPPGGLNSSRA